MAKFVDINSLTEKVNPDGNEQIQVSDTQKFVWKNALMNSGGFIGAILSYATQYAMGNTTDRQTIISMLGQLFYNTGSRADSFFRFVCGSVTIPGGTHKQEYFGIVFYDAYYTRTYAVFFGFENGAVPVTFFQRQGNYVIDSPIDDNFVTNIINGKAWTKLGTLNSQGTIYTSDVIAATSDKPITLPGQFAFPSLTDLKTDAFVKQMLYNSGYHQSNACFRQLLASYVIGGTGSKVQCYYGVTWYNRYYGRTYTMLVNMELANGEYITLYQKQGRHIESNPTDDAYVLDVLTGDWLKVAGIGTGGSEPTPIESLAAEKVNVAAPTLYDETTASTWDPNSANNLQELLNGLLYRTGLRSTSDGLNLGFRVACADGKIAIIANDSSSSDYSVFLFSGGSTIHTYLIDQTYVTEWVGNYSSDHEIISSIESDGSETGMLDMAGISNFATKSYVKPNDAVLTMFPSGYRTVIPGENLTTNLTSGTLKIKVPDLLTAQVKNGPFRDAVIDVPYGVTVQFADQVGIVYKADGVDGFTATSGRKVYTIHFVPTTSSTTNITFRAFVNVTNYK